MFLFVKVKIERKMYLWREKSSLDFR